MNLTQFGRNARPHPTVKYAAYDHEDVVWLERLRRELSRDMKKLGQMRWKSGLVPFSWAERYAVKLARQVRA